MIAVENISLRIGHFVLEEISFEIPAGRYGFLMGKTGCGKTIRSSAISSAIEPAKPEQMENAPDPATSCGGRWRTMSPPSMTSGCRQTLSGSVRRATPNGSLMDRSLADRRETI